MFVVDVDSTEFITFAKTGFRSCYAALVRPARAVASNPSHGTAHRPIISQASRVHDPSGRSALSPEPYSAVTLHNAHSSAQPTAAKPRASHPESYCGKSHFAQPWTERHLLSPPPPALTDGVLKRPLPPYTDDHLHNVHHQLKMSSTTSTYLLYEYNPSVPANAALTAVMAISLVVHMLQTIWYRTWWFGITVSLGALGETIGLIARIIAHDKTTNKTIYTIQTLTLILAPLFMMAGVYYLLAVLIHLYGRRYSWIRAKLCSYIFVIGDVISLFVQGGGGGIMAGGKNLNVGRGVIVGGLVFQLVCMAAFMLLLAVFLYRIRFMRGQDGLHFDDHQRTHGNKNAAQLPWAIIIAVPCVFIRSVYRVFEFGLTGNAAVKSKEVYFIVLEGAMMITAFAIFNVFHPGRIMGHGISLKSKPVNELKSERSAI